MDRMKKNCDLSVSGSEAVANVPKTGSKRKAAKDVAADEGMPTKKARGKTKVAVLAAEDDGEEDKYGGKDEETIKQLRREKKVADVQLLLSTQEQKRIRQQLELTQAQLDDTCLKLDQQPRTEGDGMDSQGGGDGEAV